MFVYRWVVYAGSGKSLAALSAGAATAAVLLAAAIARIGVAEVDTQLGTTPYDISLGKQRVWGTEFDTLVCAFAHGSIHGLHKPRAAVGIYVVVAAVVGHKHTFQPAALSQSAGHTEHDAIAEWHHSAVHILFGIAAIRNSVGSGSKRRIKIPAHKAEVYRQMLNTETAAMPLGARRLACGMVVAIGECDGQRDTVSLVVEKSGAVEPSGIDYHRILRCLNSR